MSSCPSLIFSHIFLCENIHRQMIVSSLDTNVALPNRSSSIVEEQRNPCLWNGHLHISLYPSLIKYSPWECYRLDRGGAGRERLRDSNSLACMYGVTFLDHSLWSYILLLSQNSPTRFFFSFYNRGSTQYILFLIHE